MKLLLISLLCFFQLHYVNHKFYVSVTDIEYVSEKQSLQIITRVFADDVEDVLAKRYQIPMQLLPEKETQDADRWIKKYLKQKFIVSVDQEIVTLNYVGKRYEDDRIYLYLEIQNLSKFKEITIENLILTDLYEEQKNLVHVKLNNNMKSAVLTKENSIHTFNH